jgi:serine/threonine protein phosphatase 1
MKSLPLWYEDEHRVYVHAALSDKYPLDKQGSVILWGRYSETQEANWPKHVVHGHTPVQTPTLLASRTNLDTGAVFGGPLSVGVFLDDKPGGPVDIWEFT